MNKTDREKESLDELKAIQSSQDYTEYKEIIKSKKPEVQTIQEKPPQQWKTTYSIRTHKNQCQIAYYYMNWEFVFGGVPCAADFCHCHIHFVAQIFVENGWIHFRLLDFLCAFGIMSWPFFLIWILFVRALHPHRFLQRCGEETSFNSWHTRHSSH